MNLDKMQKLHDFISREDVTINLDSWYQCVAGRVQDLFKPERDHWNTLGIPYIDDMQDELDLTEDEADFLAKDSVDAIRDTPQGHKAAALLRIEQLMTGYAQL